MTGLVLSVRNLFTKRGSNLSQEVRRRIASAPITMPQEPTQFISRGVKTVEYGILMGMVVVKDALESDQELDEYLIGEKGSERYIPLD